MKLERHANDYGREFFFLGGGGGVKPWRNKPEKIAGEMRWQFSKNSPDQIIKFTPNPLCRISGSKESRVYANFFEKFVRTFAFFPCDTSQEPNGNGSDKLVQMNFFILGDFFGWEFCSCEYIGAEKTMTATDATGFDAIFSTGFFSTFSRFWGARLTKLHREPGEKAKNPVESLQWRRRPEIADFCPLSWSNVSWIQFTLCFPRRSCQESLDGPSLNGLFPAHSDDVKRHLLETPKRVP